MLRFLSFVALLLAVVGAKWGGKWSSEKFGYGGYGGFKPNYGGYKPSYGGYKPYPYTGGNNQSPLASILASLAAAGSNSVPGAGVAEFPGTIGVIGANGVPIATGTSGTSGTGALPIRVES